MSRKQIVHKRIEIPANAQPADNSKYDFRFDKGTEEVSIMFSRTTTSSNESDYYQVFFIANTVLNPSPNYRDVIAPGNFGTKQTGLSSKYVYTFQAPTLFNPGLVYKAFIFPVQTVPITIDLITLVNTEDYIFSN